MEFKTVRLAQINILNDPAGLDQRYARLKSHLQRVNPDVVCLQEVIDSELLETALKPLGFHHFYHADPFIGYNNSPIDHTTIASRFPIAEASDLSFNDLAENTRNTSLAKIQFPEREGFISSSHFAWGGNVESIRLRQAERLNHVAESFLDASPGSFFMLAGDLNADEDSRTIRYLQGKDLAIDNLGSTYWTDAYGVAGSSDTWATSDHSKGVLGPATAAKYGILEQALLPARRIDYIMTYGWAYGKVGCANNFGRFGDPLTKKSLELSDHWGVWADILI